jgi:hypothetical protein
MEEAEDTRSKRPLPDMDLSAPLFINLFLIRNIELTIEVLGGATQ